MKNIISVTLLIFIASYSLLQSQSNWQNYSDMKNTKSVISDGSGGIWTASKGGAFYFNLQDSTFQTFSRVQGLNGIDLTSVGKDEKNIWFGSSNGTIDVYNLTTKSFRTILDIFNSDKTNKSINDIKSYGDTVFIATDFGISLIESKNYLFLDTYFKFGGLSSNIRVNSVIKTDLIYAATAEGVVIQKSGATNLSAPESWNVYSQNEGLPSGSIQDLAFYNDNLFAATNSGVYTFSNNMWQLVLGTSGKILDLLTADGLLYLLTPNKISTFNGLTVSDSLNLNNNASKLGYSESKGILIVTNKGISINGSLIYPSGPEANQFPNMVIDKNGNFWSASGKDVSGVGIYEYDGQNWFIYNSFLYPELFRNSYYSIFCASDNTIYSGSWGDGFVRIRNNRITRFHSGNTNMVGIPGNSNFIVITGFAEDSRNNIWILNLNAADRKSLYMLTPDSSWYFYSNPLEQHIGFTEIKNLVIDRYDTKWYSLGNEGSLGLFYYNEKNTYGDPADDVYGYITTSKGLTSNSIFSLAVDRRGDLWVGTSLGVSIITNVNAVLNTLNPQLKVSNSFSVRQQTINALAVDPLNQKWLGTNQGLFLLSSDGAQLLANLNTKNSPLLSDVIESITIDEKTGKVFVGTANGLNTFETPSILPVESFNGLNIFPNPLIIKDGSKLVTIDGLIRNTDIKIISVSGKLIREFSSPGGRTAYWDGRDDGGNLVNSGIYIVIAFDQEGNSVETGKIAVLRE